MGYQGKFSGKNPPLACKSQVAEAHITKRNVFPAADLADMLGKPRSQRSLALSLSLRRLADVNKFGFEIEGVNTAFMRPTPFREREQRAAPQLIDDLGADAPVEVEIKMVRIFAQGADAARSCFRESKI